MEFLQAIVIFAIFGAIIGGMFRFICWLIDDTIDQNRRM